MTAGLGEGYVSPHRLPVSPRDHAVYVEWWQWYAEREGYATAGTDDERAACMERMLGHVTEDNPPYRAIPLYRAVAEEPGAEDATVRAVSLIMIFGIIIAFIEIVLLVILG
jgi:hypothetical protein